MGDKKYNLTERLEDFVAEFILIESLQIQF